MRKEEGMDQIMNQMFPYTAPSFLVLFPYLRANSTSLQVHQLAIWSTKEMLSVLQIIQHRSGIYCFSPTNLMEANNSQIITQSSTTGSAKILLHQYNQVQIKEKKKRKHCQPCQKCMQNKIPCNS